MHASTGQALLIALPLLVTAGLVLASVLDQRRAASPTPGYWRRNGLAVGLYILVAVLVWTVVTIVLPLLAMVDLSFRPKLPPAQTGGPLDVYTLQNYAYFLFGSTTSTAAWNAVHLRAFAITMIASVLVTLANFAICYPVAYHMAQDAGPARLRFLLLLLVTPYWVNEILRAFAFRVLFASQGVVNEALRGLGLVSEPVDFIGQDVALYVGLAYAYLLLMMFPLYSAISSLDHKQIEAARDLGAGTLQIHRDIVLPHAKPGIASGMTLVFMLSAGSLAAPQILGGPSSLWFTPIVYDRFYQAFNWPQGAAYAFILLTACLLFVLGVMRVFRVGLGAIAR